MRVIFNSIWPRRIVRRTTIPISQGADLIMFYRREMLRVVTNSMYSHRKKNIRKLLLGDNADDDNDEDGRDE